MENPKIELDMSDIIPPERIEYFREKGLSEKEINDLIMAEAISNETEVIPEDPTDAIKRIEGLSDDPTVAIKQFFELGEKDPKAFAETIAVVDAMDRVIANMGNQKGE